GSHVHLGAGYWSIQRIALIPVCHPALIAPRIVQDPHDRGRLGRNLVKNGERVGFVHLIAVISRANVEFVQRSSADSREKTLPDTRLLTGVERMRVLCPIVERADNRHLLRIWCPYRKTRTGYAVPYDRMGTQLS